jgi:hypothetical protein
MAAPHEKGRPATDAPQATTAPGGNCYLDRSTIQNDSQQTAEPIGTGVLEDLNFGPDAGKRLSRDLNERNTIVFIVDDRFVYLIDAAGCQTLVAIADYTYRIPGIIHRYHTRTITESDGERVARTLAILATLRSAFLPEPTIDMEDFEQIKAEAKREEAEREGADYE